MDEQRLPSTEEIASAVRRGDADALSFAKASLAAIDALDGVGGAGLGAMLTVDAEGALAAARSLDERLARLRAEGSASEALQRRFALAGVPIVLKDALCTRGLRTTCGSRMLERYTPPYDAHVVAKLRAAGAIIVGKSNMDEFSMGSSTEHSAFFCAKNPWDPSRVPGGSSGGSAVAVAAGMTRVALGSDTGGSARQPAALTGVVGFKPSYGRVSRHGLVAFASSLDVVSPIAATVREAELVYAVIAGRDERDATSEDRPVERADFSRGEGALAGRRVGVVRELLEDGVDASVRAVVVRALEKAERAGATLVECSLGHERFALAAYYVVAAAEASSNLARFDGVRFGARPVSEREDHGAERRAGAIEVLYRESRAAGFGLEVKRRMILGTHVLAEGHDASLYRRAQRARALVCEDFARAFEAVDVLASPTSPTLPWPLGERASDPMAMYRADACTVPASLAGLCAVSVPAGVVTEGATSWPVGLQLIGRRFDEAALFAVAYGFERVLGTLKCPMSRR